MKTKITSSLLLLFTTFSLVSESFAATKYVSVGTGSITGVYYPAGGAICRLLNRGRKDHGIRCSVESTGGSVSNINAIRNGALDFGIAQSDWQYSAYNGTGFFADQKPFKELRSVFSLYSETFTIVVLDKSNIQTIDDLVGKKVNFGPRGSGMNATMEVLASVKGWQKSDFASVTYLQPSEQPKALCEGKIDVMIYAAGNPNGVLQEVTQTCKARILEVDKKTIASLMKTGAFYVPAIIPGGMYANNPKDVRTFGVNAALLTSEKTDPEVVYQLTKAVFENFENFKTLHPVFASLDKDRLVYEGNTAPLHPGAERYFREAGMLKKR